MSTFRAWAPFLFLLVVPPILIEVLSANTPPLVFFKPLFFLVYIVVYGFPIILIADAMARWKLSLFGSLILSYAYGLYNEAIVAKTVFARHVLSPSYNGYGELLGLNFPWLFSILTFHAFLSVLFPILLAQELFPQRLMVPFLSQKIRFILLAITGVFGYLLFQAPNAYVPPLGYFWIFAGLIGLAIIVAKYTARGVGITKDYTLVPTLLGPVLYGCLAPILFLITLGFITSIDLPVIVYFLFSALFLTGYSYLVIRRYRSSTRHIILIALGSYIGTALIGLLFNGGLTGNWDVLIWNILSIFILIIIIRQYKNTFSTTVAN